MAIEASPFDSKHYGIRIGRWTGGDPANALAEIAAAGASYDVVFARLVERDPVRDVLERAGHRAVDILVTSTLAAGPPLVVEREVERHPTLSDPADIAAVVAIATASLRTSHLHADPRLPPERTAALYAEWTTNDVTGRADHTLIVRAPDGAPSGFLTALATATTCSIDLVAVDPARHGGGAGSALVGHFVNWARARGGTATVGTQHDNPALRLYQRTGFVPSAKHFTYHLWL